VKGLGLGADDYLPNPSIRTSSSPVSTPSCSGPRGTRNRRSPAVISINLGEQGATIAGNPVHLTAKEYQLLELLALRKGSTLPKDAILNQLYGGV